MIDRAKRSFCALIFLLAVGLAGIEAPELATLTDDVSNDSVVVLPLEEVLARLGADHSARADSLTFERPVFLPLEGYQSAPRVPRAGRDLLHLLTVQRK